MDSPYREPSHDEAQSWQRLARAEIERLLLPDEEVLWVGRPRQGLHLTPLDAFQIPFSLMWGGFAIFWETQVLRMGAPLFFALWGMPFVAVGLYLIAGRFFVDRALRARTYYGLTSGRVIVVKAGRRRAITSVDLGAEPRFHLSEGRRGRGTIAWGSASSRRIPAVPNRFEGIEDARAVYSKLLEAQRAIREPLATRHRVAPLLRVEASPVEDTAESADEIERSRRS
jgi:hypothetical protein